MYFLFQTKSIYETFNFFSALIILKKLTEKMDLEVTELKKNLFFLFKNFGLLWLHQLTMEGRYLNDSSLFRSLELAGQIEAYKLRLGIGFYDNDDWKY